jgi:hypothetical protein
MFQGASMGLGKHYWNIKPEHYTPLCQVSVPLPYLSQV